MKRWNNTIAGIVFTVGAGAVLFTSHDKLDFGDIVVAGLFVIVGIILFVIGVTKKTK